MKEIQITLQVIQIISTLFIAFVGWRITANYNKAQLREIEQKYKPYPIITKLINNSTIDNNDIIFGTSKVPTQPYEKITNIQEIKNSGLYNKIIKGYDSENGNGTVYHIMYKNERHLVYNFLRNDQDIIFDCAPTIIIIKNIGYDLCSYCIQKVIIEYKNGGKIELASKEKWQQKYVSSQDEFYLLLSMVTNNNNLTLCDINGLEQETKTTFNQRVDLLEIDFSNNFLDYNKMEIYLLAKSSMTKEYKFKISILVDGDRLTSFTEEVVRK